MSYDIIRRNGDIADTRLIYASYSIPDPLTGAVTVVDESSLPNIKWDTERELKIFRSTAVTWFYSDTMLHAGSVAAKGASPDKIVEFTVLVGGTTWCGA